MLTYFKRAVLVLVLFMFSLAAISQSEKRSMEAVRIDSKIKIDGELDEEAWSQAKPFEGNFVEQEFLPDEISGMKFYEPGNNARENELRKFLSSKWKEKYGY